MNRVACVVLALVAGCSRQAPMETSPLDQPVAVVARPSFAATDSTNPTSCEDAPDLGGRVVAHAVAPDTPALEPLERFAVAPRPRAPSTPIVELDPTPKARHLPTPFVPESHTRVRLSLPMERVPLDLGVGADAVPVQPNLPVKAAPTKRSRDVNQPPPVPTLGRALRDRVGYEDPTTEFGNAVITGPPVRPPFAPVPFLKVGVPDPFELGDQIRPTIPPAIEPGLTPVTVNPRRVK